MSLPFFVYGTLLPGQPNAFLWEDDLVAAEPAVFANGRLYDMGHYPMLVEEKGTQVRGQIVTVRPAAYTAVLQRLDMLEGYNPAQPNASAYRRLERVVQRADGTTISAWTYLGHARYVAGRPPIPGGHWPTYVAQKQDQLQNWWATIHTVAGLHKEEDE